MLRLDKTLNFEFWLVTNNKKLALVWQALLLETPVWNFNCAEASFSLHLIFLGPETRSVMIGYKGAAKWTPPHRMCHKTCVTNQKPPWSWTTNDKPAESL